MAKKRVVKLGNGVGVDMSRMTFLGFLSITALILSGGRLEIFKRHGMKTLVEYGKPE
ncbi:hypothetical protein OE699_01970 [Sedimentimonas flavescens]|uniref:Uncharacterized protein n=1 Tax=Sedimentimonas flavescens TaxID=2851012 RepID=A0ABT2ZV27_9RHOB|nr:hypothetical protein [Sedimentimonas flavescens]MCV2877606.1 hypothetical protein [Sedimentimonas flavescens]